MQNSPEPIFQIHDSFLLNLAPAHHCISFSTDSGIAQLNCHHFNTLEQTLQISRQCNRTWLTDSISILQKTHRVLALMSSTPVLCKKADVSNVPFYGDIEPRLDEVNHISCVHRHSLIDRWWHCLCDCKEKLLIFKAEKRQRSQVIRLHFEH